MDDIIRIWTQSGTSFLRPTRVHMAQDWV